MTLILQKFRSGFSVSHLFIIRSLSEMDVGLAVRVHDDLVEICKKHGLEYRLFEPSTARELRLTMLEIARLARIGFRPLIHLDMHGLPSRGVEIASSGEFISWDDMVIYFRNINVGTRNNLCVVAMICFGFDLLATLDIQRECPFYTLIAPSGQLLAGFIEENVLNFYRDFLGGGGFISSFERHLMPEMEVFHSEKALLVILVRYIRDSCAGRGRQLRVERLLSRAIGAGAPNLPITRRSYRRKIKTGIKPSQALVDSYVRSFLMNKPVSFDINTVLTILRKLRK